MSTDFEPAGSVDAAFVESAVQQAALLMRARGSAFYRCGPNQNNLRLVATHGLARIPWGEGLLVRVCESQAPVTAGVSPVIEGHSEQLQALAVPATWRDAVQGVLVVADDTPDRTFAEADAALLQPLADLTAAALHQADRLARMTAQFRALHVLDVALASSLQLDRMLSLILEQAVDLVGAEHGSLRLLNPETDELVLKAYLGVGWTQEVKAYTFPVGHGITGWVAKHRRPYLCLDAHHDPQNVVLFAEMRSGVAVPLVFCAEEEDQEELLGVMLLESAQPAAFDQHDVELLQALAQEAVIAIQNATQQQKLQLMNQALLDEQERRVAAERWEVMGQAATALAHRINNLVGIVPASAGEIRRTLDGLDIAPGDRAWIENNLDRIERNGQFILRLADALFRPFQEPGPRALFDVNRLLNEALQAASLPKSVEVVRDFGHALPDVESSSLLVDIFLELITNALKALEAQPLQRLTVRTRAEAEEADEWVIVEISDTGVGIPPEQMAHLWTMFKQSESGLGFGLWWVRTFIERQGGTIVCDSGPGAGATFTVRLPAYPGVALLET